MDILTSVQQIIGLTASGSEGELSDAVVKLRKQIGTEYYDGKGDDLFEMVADWIEDFWEAKENPKDMKAVAEKARAERDQTVAKQQEEQQERLQKVQDDYKPVIWQGPGSKGRQWAPMKGWPKKQSEK